MKGPKRHHAVELAMVALEILDSVRKFKVKNRPANEQVQLRAGIHSGRVAAGSFGNPDSELSRRISKR